MDICPLVTIFHGSNRSIESLFLFVVVVVVAEVNFGMILCKNREVKEWDNTI